MKQKLIYLFSLLLLAILPSCEDKFEMPGYDIPEGVSTFGVEVGFKDFVPALGSRSDGDAIKKIETLWVVIYDKSGNFIEKREIEEGDFKLENTGRPDGKPSSESQTGCAKFNLTLENGWYKIYAVANHDLSEVDDEEIDSEDKLASLSFEWQEPNSADPNDSYTNAAKRNAQMFGYFEEGSVHSTSRDGADKAASEQLIVKAEPVAIRSNATKIHAWLRRAASKLTVAFDTDNLNENIYIYIKSIALKDIPKYCRLGKMNSPTNRDSLIGKGEVIYLADAKETDGNGKDEHSRWRELAKGNVIYGLYSDKIKPSTGTKEERKELEHSEAAPALYFYENMQGQGVEGTVTDKRQDVSGKNNQISYPDGYQEGGEGWKDAKEYGTYVEVDGYYVNHGNKRPGRGPIRYRFMLGKDEKTDYDANRNHHYKLTMKFNGNANDVDFHIDYDEEQKPGFFTPDTVFVSYMYNDQSGLTLRATPRKGYDLKKITAVIINNEWRPDGANDNQYNRKAWDAQTDGTGDYSEGTAINNAEGYNEVFEASTYDSIPADPRSTGRNYDGKCAPNCEFGFLSLRRTRQVTYNWGGAHDKTKIIVDKSRELYFATGSYSNERQRGKRVYGENHIPKQDTGKDIIVEDETDGNYSISRTTTKGMVDYVFSLPLYTRAKTMDSWATFTGANCFYQHYRYACIKFIAEFEKTDGTATGPQTYRQVSYTHVNQARRVENPSGIYRKAESMGTTFDVHLTYSLLSNTSDGTWFLPIVSRGPWSAIIECDPANIIKLSNGSATANGEGSMLTGRTNTEIKFKVTQNKNLKDSESKGAVILVRYHNNTCSHRIIVRQGYAAIQMGDDPKRLWSTYNIYSKDALAKNPLSPGSLFRRFTSLDYPIAESNNTRTGFGFGKELKETSKYKVIGQIDLTWDDIEYDKMPDHNNFGGTFDLICPYLANNAKRKYQLPSADYLEELGIYPSTATQIHLDKRNYVMGIFYGDGASGTQYDKRAFSFSDPDNTGEPSECGVRGIGCYYLKVNVSKPGVLLDEMKNDPLRGNSIFFSLGATGHPRRKGRYLTLPPTVLRKAYGIMRYGGVDGTLESSYDIYRPMAWDLGNQRGACYWVATGSSNKETVALDFNTGNFMTNHLPMSEVYLYNKESDALPIKPVVAE